MDDVVQTAFVAAYQFWPVIRHPRGFIYRVARNAIAALRRRQQRDRSIVQRWVAGGSVPTAGKDLYHLHDTEVVLESLSALPRRERQVLAAAIDGYGPTETARVLGISPEACRVHMCNARERLRPVFIDENGTEILQVMLGPRMFRAWTAGEKLPVTPRPLVTFGWERSMKLKVDRKRGAAAKLLTRNEVNHLRRELPIFGYRWLLDKLADVGQDEGVMSVVTNAQGIVLWRGGHRPMLDRAGDKGFDVGASWAVAHQGSNGISLALITGRPVKMTRWEHYLILHHQWCCYATPFRDPSTGRLLGTLNITSPRPIHHHLMRHLDTLTGRLHQQLSSCR